VLDVINGGGKCSLRDANDPIAHVLRDETVIVPDNTDHGMSIFGKISVGMRTIASIP
jgi:hypothetical protein